MGLDKPMTNSKKILLLLRSSGSAGLNSIDLRLKHRIINPSFNITELKKEGCRIVTRRRRNGSVDYILLLEPHATEEPVKTPEEWQVRETLNGQPIARLGPKELAKQEELL